MKNVSSRRIPWFALLFGLVLIPVTYLLSASGKVQVNAEALKMFAPLPAVMASPDNPITDAKVTLGRILYYDARLSANQKISCNTCHPLDAYGAQTSSVSTGFRNQKGKRNAPTVYNAAGHFVQFWDGRAPTVEEQAKGPITNPVEMAMPSNRAAVQVIQSMPEYVALFQAAFPQDTDPITYNNMALAIGAFERGLVTPSKWDAFIQGDQAALSDVQKQGFNTFTATGCQWCHAGAYVGGAAYQKLGVVKPWPNQDDAGVYQLTKDEMDRMVFKVPSLRNISKTGPYFHDGSVATLDQAIRNMAVHQRGVDLSAAQVKSIEAWLDSLTGPVPAKYIQAPDLPESTAQTPLPSGE
ncbi:MAG TPA: cytochrome c peroxidase [Candidatus Sulfotelmatobacter sp.]|nr:cytochrome c peroxidase [Candidatus Sulfotelmatobacter sp.]